MDAYLLRSQRYDLRPTRAQERRLIAINEGQRLLYNAAIEHRRKAYLWACGQASILGLARFDRKAIEAISPYALDPPRQAIRLGLLAWRGPDLLAQRDALTKTNQRALFGEVVEAGHTDANRATLEAVDVAYRGFMRRAATGKTPGFPRFKGFGRFRTFGFAEYRDGHFVRPEAIAAGGKGLGSMRIPGVDGAIEVAMYRHLPEGAEVRSIRITRRDARWVVSLMMRVPAVFGLETDAMLADLAEDEVYGLDAGVKYAETSSTGRHFVGPRAAKRARKALGRAQRHQARCVKGSGNQRRAKGAVAKVHRKVANVRKDGDLKMACAIVEDALAHGCRVIGHEDLRIANMVRSAKGTLAKPGRNVRAKSGLNFAILDSGMANRRKRIACKAESAGMRSIGCEPRGTSQDCSACGAWVPKTLGVRIHRCGCGTVMCRDENAARNVRTRVFHAALKLSASAEARPGRGGGRYGSRRRRLTRDQAA